MSKAMKNHLLGQPVKRGRGRPPGAVQRFTVQQVADMFQVSPKTVHAWTETRLPDGKPVLPKEKLGRFVRIKETDLAHLEERLARRAAPSFFSEHDLATSGGAVDE